MCMRVSVLVCVLLYVCVFDRVLFGVVQQRNEAKNWGWIEGMYSIWLAINISSIRYLT